MNDTPDDGYDVPPRASDDDSIDEMHEIEVAAGELEVSVNGESSDEAYSQFQKVWNKVTDDIDELSEDERDAIQLQ